MLAGNNALGLFIGSNTLHQPPAGAAAQRTIGLRHELQHKRGACLAQDNSPVEIFANVKNVGAQSSDEYAHTVCRRANKFINGTPGHPPGETPQYLQC
jgi:hypothetical protein